MKIKVKYHIEANINAEQVIIECQTLEEAERKLKNFLKMEQEAYIVKTVETGKSIEEKFFII
jgi:urease accessory protein UreH